LFLSGFVSVENKECLICFPKLDVAGSIPVVRSIYPQQNRKVELKESDLAQRSFDSSTCGESQPPEMTLTMDFKL
jgi:hypothetical protein